MSTKIKLTNCKLRVAEIKSEFGFTNVRLELVQDEAAEENGPKFDLVGYQIEKLGKLDEINCIAGDNVYLKGPCLLKVGDEILPHEGEVGDSVVWHRLDKEYVGKIVAVASDGQLFCDDGKGNADLGWPYSFGWARLNRDPETNCIIQ